MMRVTINYGHGVLNAKPGEESLDGEAVRVREDGSYTIIEAGTSSRIEGREDAMGQVRQSFRVLTAKVVSVSMGEATEKTAADA